MTTLISALPVAKPVRKRAVFYLSGFDPKGVRHYYHLYKSESVKQASVSGQAISVGPRRKTDQGNAAWQLNAETADGAVETRYEFLRWDDIVRSHWGRHHGQLMWDVIATTCLNFRHGALWRMLKLALPPVLALFLPFVLLCLVLLGGPLLAVLIYFMASSWTGVSGAVALALLGLAACVQTGLWLQGKYSMLWLMRSYAFTAKQAQGQVPELEARLHQHAQTLLARIAVAQDDEVLLVGHSSGTIMAVSVLAKALRLNPMLGKVGPSVSLLTLGQCMPMLGCLPQATEFRDDLRLISTSPGLSWVDFTAPPDGCCFALVDPLAGCGAPEAARFIHRPKLLSPRLADMFDPKDYANIRRDKFRVHFQYLMATERPSTYDYFAITTGPMTLANRFSGSQSITNFSRFQIHSWFKK